MTKLPETISKKINVFNGCEVGTIPKFQPVNRCVGGTTAVALSVLGEAQLRGASIGFDFDNYEESKGMIAATHLMSNIEGLIKKLGFRGFTVKVKKVTDCRGLRGFDYHSIACRFKPFELESAYCVYVTFDPIVEVFYDLRK